MFKPNEIRQLCSETVMTDLLVWRHIVIFTISLTFLVVLGGVSQASAEEPREETDFTYEEFEANVRVMAERLLASCQSDDGQSQSTVDLSDDEVRRACGEKLNGQEIKKSPYIVDYQYEDELGVAIDSFGVSRRLFLGAIQYRLIMGWVTQVGEERSETPGRLTYGEALLFQKTKFGFVQIWSYVDHDGSWDRIEQDQPTLYLQFSPAEVTFVHDTWSDKVNAELDLYIAAGGPDL